MSEAENPIDTLYRKPMTRLREKIMLARKESKKNLERIQDLCIKTKKNVGHCGDTAVIASVTIMFNAVWVAIPESYNAARLEIKTLIDSSDMSDQEEKIKTIVARANADFENKYSSLKTYLDAILPDGHINLSANIGHIILPNNCSDIFANAT
jgi:hypothetical protein